NKKPIGIYWLQAAAVTAATPLTGGKLNEIWPYRLPSALGAALAALAALWGGRALLPRRTAFFGALAFATCLILGAEGRIAKTDAVLCGLTTLAMAALARLRSRFEQAPPSTSSGRRPDESAPQERGASLSVSKGALARTRILVLLFWFA